MKTQTTIIVKTPAARNKGLHFALAAKKGGRMFDRKKDFSRAKEKQAGRAAMYE